MAPEAFGHQPSPCKHKSISVECKQRRWGSGTRRGVLPFIYVCVLVSTKYLKCLPIPIAANGNLRKVSVLVL
ncbi:hypothetical protein XELAEV_18018408mg [Xenopus laevis]|uniref:Uncharacterized protein n=1 Tax=Xenopus laevis TaxID=8355 RepID=A0A974HTL6_XENLA|nr:hypothetical protein XELAEV_18018408mg [Xenopus laevis]